MNQKVLISEGAKHDNIVRQCYLCHAVQVMTSTEFVLKSVGYHLPDHGWICQSCGDHIVAIKNM